MNCQFFYLLCFYILNKAFPPTWSPSSLPLSLPSHPFTPPISFFFSNEVGHLMDISKPCMPLWTEIRDTPPPIPKFYDAIWQENWVPKIRQQSRRHNLHSLLGILKEDQVIYSRSTMSRAGSQFVPSVSVNTYERRLVGSLGFLLVPFTPLFDTTIILPPCLLQVFLSSVKCLVVSFWICFHPKPLR